MLNIFLSKNIAKDSVLQELYQNSSINLCAESFIEFNVLDFPISNWKGIDFVFFGSKNAAVFYLSKNHIPGHVSIAVVGESTKKQIVNTGLSVAYEAQPGNLDEAAKDFSEFVKNRKVLFPISKQSYRTFSKYLDPKQIKIVEVYETLPRDISVENNFDYLIFTSPSNVNSFIAKHEVQNNQKIIAWGESTKKCVLKHNLNVFKTLLIPSEEELLKVLKEII